MHKRRIEAIFDALEGEVGVTDGRLGVDFGLITKPSPPYIPYSLARTSPIINLHTFLETYCYILSTYVSFMVFGELLFFHIFVCVTPHSSPGR